MDSNQKIITNTTRDSPTPIEEYPILLYDQFPFDILIGPHFPHQTPPPPPPPPPFPTQTPPSNNLSLNQTENTHHINQEKKHHEQEEEQEEELGPMKEMMYKIAAMQTVEEIDPSTVKKPKRQNVRISNDPQSVAARLRRERISERIRILQRLVPGGTKMDTASMLDEAICYIKFLKRQIRQLQLMESNHHCLGLAGGGAALSAVEPLWRAGGPYSMAGTESRF